jgi:hypothetical protein
MKVWQGWALAAAAILLITGVRYGNVTTRIESLEADSAAMFERGHIDRLTASVVAVVDVGRRESQMVRALDRVRGTRDREAYYGTAITLGLALIAAILHRPPTAEAKADPMMG